MVSSKKNSASNMKLTRELVIAGLLTVFIQFGISWALPQVSGAPTSGGSTNTVDETAMVEHNSDESGAPDGMPAAIGQSDGSMYTYKEEVVGEDGTHSYVYSGEEEDFEGGGLGDAELIITEDEAGSGDGSESAGGSGYSGTSDGNAGTEDQSGNNMDDGSGMANSGGDTKAGSVGETQQEYYGEDDGEEMPETTVSIG